MSKPRLSKNLLQMKFMQRCKVREEIEQVDAVQKKMKTKLVERKKRDKTSYRTEPSYVELEDITFGRLSFQGFNSEVERWMAHYAALREEANTAARSREMKKDISDEEAAMRLCNVARTIGKKFATKRHRAEALDDGDSDLSAPQHKKSSKRFRHPVSAVQ